MASLDTHPVSSPGRRRAAAVSLMLAPIVMVLGAALWPAGSDGSTAEELQAAATHPAGWGTASVLDLLMWVLLLPGAIGILGQLRGRGRTLAMVGTIGVAAGAVATCVVGGVNLVVVPVIALQPDRATAARLLDAVTGQPVTAPFVLLIYVGLVGVALLAFGATRGRLVRWWVPALLLVGIVVNVGLNNGLYGVASAATFLPLALAEAVLGVALFGGGNDAAASVAPAAVDTELAV